LRLLDPNPVRTWTLTKLRETPIKLGAKVVRPAKAITFPVAVPRALFAARLGRMAFEHFYGEGYYLWYVDQPEGLPQVRFCLRRELT
jgi:hypothetical protein